ncbi:hypothetical protein HOA55_03085 [archaeon]|jgi:hypothetical protein|nr:hypothetical protein [archaeon]MBT3577442.1 hypothetical protein [archaeon]MBT6820315.1 hypothetical protein [archaeon]MBT6956762.1 hypothetical protein [archaeon]MBT7025129.1 hypothetical protein [archaeon]
MGWETIERPGYLGKKRDEVVSNWNEQFGKNNWRLTYQWNNEIVSREFAIQLYEDGYCEFFKKNLDILEWLVSSYSDVYDTATSNVKSKFDYTRQETPNKHIHDIAVRKSVARLGKEFQGEDLLHIRWLGSDGMMLNPGVVPFHMPELIVPGEVKDYGGKGTWWYEKTIEDFYQRNKVLQVWK